MVKLAEALKAFMKIVITYQRDKLFKLNFAVTYKCNSRCRMCNIWKRYIESPQMVKEELAIEEISQIFKGFGKLVWVSLTGGEPFLRHDLADIAQSLRDHCQIRMLNITTNGFKPGITEDRVHDIAEVKVPLTFINVSLDGPAEVHDHVRGIKGAYNNAVKTLELLRMLSKQHSNLLIGLEYTITPFNAGYLKLLVDGLKEAELSWLLENLTITIYHQGNLYDNLDLNSKQQFNNNSFIFKALTDVNYALNLAQGTSPLTLMKKTYLKYARKYVRDKRAPLQCVALQNSLFLDPYGNVYPCIILEHKIGNLRNYQYDIYKLLKSESALKAKREVEVCKKCWTPCEAYPSILTHLTSLFRA
jgi:MoaA/NifB/PqqE/SkfB family radical SAM enzyme